MTSCFGLKYNGFSSWLLVGVLLLLCFFSACGQESSSKAPAMSREQAEAQLKAVEKINEREIQAAKKSGDSKKLEDAKIASTERLAKAQRVLDQALVAETNKLVERKQRK